MFQLEKGLDQKVKNDSPCLASGQGQQRESRATPGCECQGDGQKESSDGRSCTYFCARSCSDAHTLAAN